MKFLKLPEGLLQPFVTTIFVKQGCVLSPLLFNLYIDRISKIFDPSCSPVKINNKDFNCLLWADDLLLVSETPQGLQNCINKMEKVYTDLDLKINIKKTKVIIFNKKGTTMVNKFQFYLKGEKFPLRTNTNILV